MRALISVMILYFAFIANGFCITVTMTPSSDTIICKDDTVAFGASTSGAQGTVTYSWTFQNGTPASSTEQNPGAVTFGVLAEGQENTCTVTVTDTKNGVACGTDSKSIKIKVPKIIISAESIDQDQRSNTTYTPLSEGVPVYGGSQNTTADNIKLKATFEPSGLQVSTYTWSVEGPGSGTYTPPPPSSTASEWNAGDIGPIPGRLNFKVSIAFNGGASCDSEREIEIGIRADHTVAIGWIDMQNVPLSQTGVAQDIKDYFPPGGAADFPNLTQQSLTFGYLGQLAAGSLKRPGLFSTTDLTSEERIYVLNWMFKYGGNVAAPPTSFSGDAEFETYATDRLQYKLLNALQVKYLIDSSGTTFSLIVILKNRTEIGITQDPVFGFPRLGRSGYQNGLLVIKNQNAVYKVNDGTPETLAVQAFNTLAQPLKWNNIGSRIAQGIQWTAGKEIVAQVYPTYYIYKNLTRESIDPQAPNPIDNFNENPYSNEFPSGSAPYLVPLP